MVSTQGTTRNKLEGVGENPRKAAVGGSATAAGAVGATPPGRDLVIETVGTAVWAPSETQVAFATVGLFLAGVAVLYSLTTDGE